MVAWKNHGLFKLGLALALGVGTHVSWANADSSTPLAPGNSSAINHQLAKQLVPKPDRPPVAKTTKPMPSSQHGTIHHKSIKKTPLINLQQSERIRNCLQASAQSRSCTSIYEGFMKHEIAMEEAAASANISPALLKAIVGIESHYNENAKSKMGAIGLMQLMPQTAIGLGLNKQSMRDPALNLNAGALHLRKLLDQFADLELAIAAYLLGENAFRNQMPPRAMGYVQNTLLLYRYFEDPIKPVGIRLEEM